MTRFPIKTFLIVLGWIGAIQATHAERPSWSPGDNEPLLKPGIAVHTFGVSPDADKGDGHATLRLYDVRDRGYAADRPTATFDTSTTFTHPDWTIDKIGNVYGIAIDKDKNIYVTASANWSPGYVGEGNSSTANVSVQFGTLENGQDDNNSAGRIYKIDAVTGQAKVFATLPQYSVTIKNQVCQGAGADVVRNNVGAGLGNVVYDKFHNQLFVSNFSDGKIYRLAMDGTILNSSKVSNGISANGKEVHSAYGLAVAPDGKMLYFGTIDTNYRPKLFAIMLDKDGNFSNKVIDQNIELTNTLTYTQNIGGGAYDGDGIWAAFSDLDFTPKGELLLGVRVGCKENFATSYNHGGVVYMLQKENDQWVASDKTNSEAVSKETVQVDVPDTSQEAQTRTGYSGSNTRKDINDPSLYRFDMGAIPLRADDVNHPDQAKLVYGPDDGYGGVAVWQTRKGDFDLLATSGDISSKEGVHGFMQFSGDFNVTDYAAVEKAIGYAAVASSTSTAPVNDDPYDYKGIGGDVEVLSVLPVSIGSYVWIDENQDGLQDDSEECLDGATVTLHRADDMSADVLNLDGKKVENQTTQDCGKYHFDNLPEGNYRVCVIPPNSDAVHYTPTVNQNTADNNDSELDSNIKETINGAYCSGTFGVFANSEPKESRDERGDDADKAHDTWGNMTVDFGFVKNVFDLALKKTLSNPNKTEYKPGETVTFNITVYNQGNVDAKKVKVVDYIPVGLELADNNWSANNDKKEATLKTPFDLKAGENNTVEITFKIRSDFEGKQIINTAEISEATNDLNLTDIDSTPGDHVCKTDIDNDDAIDQDADEGCDDIDPAPVRVKQIFDLALIKKVKGTQTDYKPGDKVTFVIGVTNQGTLTGTDIQIKDTVPKGLELADDRWEMEGDHAILKTPIPSLAPKAYVTREITFVITKDADGKIINIAEIQSADNPLHLDDNDSTPADNPCGDDMDNNDDLSDPNGCDDIDPAWLTVKKPSIPNASVTTSDAADCDCADVDSNQVDAMDLVSVLLLMLIIGLLGYLEADRERNFWN